MLKIINNLVFEICTIMIDWGHRLLKLVLCGHLGAQNAIEEVKSE